MAGMMVGCVSASRPVAPPPGKPPPGDGTDAGTLAARLRAAFGDWVGVPHRWGGTTHDGVDCSGLVQTVYRDAFGLDVPRTTRDQKRLGSPVDRDDLLPGDLLFFRTPDRHVGIYLCCGDFGHASSSRGVMISRLDEPYWRRTFREARRLLPSPRTAQPAGHARRSGW